MSSKKSTVYDRRPTAKQLKRYWVRWGNDYWSYPASARELLMSTKKADRDYLASLVDTPFCNTGVGS